MPSTQAILDDIDLRYRNTFTTAQKLVWFNEEQRELFDILEIDSPPYAFTTVQGENFYPFPDQFDVTKIKVVSMQINDDTNFIELPFERNDNNTYAQYGYPWYAIVSNAFYLNYQQEVPADRLVYIYTDSDPTEVTLLNLTSSPDLPTKYQEILKLGVLMRIAAARKDVMFESNYSDSYEQKISDVLLQRKQKEPEFSSAVDMMPPSARNRRYNTYGNSYGW